MAKREIELCSYLLRDNFGESVEKVGKYLMSQVCSRPLFMICSSVSLPRSVVNSALRFLLQHSFAEYSLNSRGFVEYCVRSEKVLHLLYYQQYMYYIKLNFGDIAELIMEELLSHGRITMSSVIKQVGEKIYEGNEAEYSPKKLAEVKEEFTKLVHMKFFHRSGCPQPGEKKRVPVLTVSDQERYAVPEVKLHLLERQNESDPPPEKKQKLDQEECPDKGIYWQIDHDRFLRYLRDQAVINGVLSGVDKKASLIVRAMLELSEMKPVTRTQLWASTSVPVAYHDILNHLKQSLSIDSGDFDLYLKVLSEDERSFIAKADDRSGGMYVVNTKKVLSRLAEEMAASVVQERFGSKSCRIFRLLLKKKYLEQKQMEELSMISPKEAKDFTYRMMKECFVTTQEISKTPDYAASRTFFLFHVDINQVCRMIVEHSYKAATNCMICLESHKKEQRRLLEKKLRLDAIVATLEQGGASAEEIEEVLQMITPPEKAMLEKVMGICDKLNRSLTQLAIQILVLKTYLYMSVAV